MIYSADIKERGFEPLRALVSPSALWKRIRFGRAKSPTRMRRSVSPSGGTILALAHKWDVPVFTTDRRFEKYPVPVIRQW